MTHKGYTCSAQNLNGEINNYHADDMNAYSLYIKDIRKSQRLSREEETELLKKAGTGDVEAKKKGYRIKPEARYQHCKKVFQQE